MEALYGYMTESEKEESIFLLESKIEFDRMVLNSEMMLESGGNTGNRLNKIFESIKKFISDLLEKVKNLFSKKREDMIKKELKNLPDMKFDTDIRKELAELKQSTNQYIKETKSKTPRITEETKRKIKKGLKRTGAIVISATAAYALYKEYQKFMNVVNEEAEHIKQVIMSVANSRPKFVINNKYADESHTYNHSNSESEKKEIIQNLRREGFVDAYINYAEGIRTNTINAGNTLHRIAQKFALVKINNEYGISNYKYPTNKESLTRTRTDVTFDVNPKIYFKGDTYPNRIDKIDHILDKNT